MQRRWLNRETVLMLIDDRSEFPQFACKIADPVGFLVTDMSHIADPSRTFGKERNRGQRLNGVANRVHVDIDATQRVPCHFNIILTIVHVATHHPQGFAKLDVTLQTLARKFLDRNGSSRDRGHCKKVTRCRCIRFDCIIPRLIVTR